MMLDFLNIHTSTTNIHFKHNFRIIQFSHTGINYKKMHLNNNCLCGFSLVSFSRKSKHSLFTHNIFQMLILFCCFYSSCISSGNSCGFNMPGILRCIRRLLACSSRSAASLSSKYKSESSSPVIS